MKRYSFLIICTLLTGLLFTTCEPWIVPEAVFVNFNANGGQGDMKAQRFEKGIISQQLSSNEFTRTGYVFVGWNTRADGKGTSYADMEMAEIKKSVTLYAQWSMIYKVHFNANGGTGTMAAQTFVAGVAQAIAANTFTRDGYAFAGWNTKADGSGTSYKDKQSITLSQDITLYAQWKQEYVVSGTENGHDYVDLGLPSGTKWATCNVGATTPEGSGDYFAWGETSPKSNYDWSTYKYCNGSKTTLTKYNTNSDYGTVDNKTTLELSDDAARVNWGGSWRMPTRAERNELTKNCTWTWTTQNGVKGYKVTSKTNGNSIFLPAAGFRDGTSVYTVGSIGRYWSSSLYEGPIFAYYLYFDSGNMDWDSNYHRYIGHTVRAVCGDNTAVQTFTLTFNANGGTGTMAAQTFEASVSQALAANAFTRSGYTFTGWNTSPDGSGTAYTDQQEITLSEDLTLYAQWKQEQVVSGSENGYDYVDLGLPSGLKWATCNVGATTPEGYGDYFAWGETSPKSNYAWSTYKYCNGSYSTLTKYNTSSDYGTVDNKTTLDLSDDAARANWGGKWRMPTKAEQDELRDNCTWTWTTENGVNGCRLTSKTNGNSVFLPATGYRDDTSVYDVGSVGHVWSSSLYERYPSLAYELHFHSGSVGRLDNPRCNGRTVRAVFSENDTPSTFVTLSFNANGGDGTMSPQIFEAGVSQALAANAFTRSGYTFTGWNTNADGSGTSYTDGQEITLTQDITLYAQWESAGGSGGGSSTSGTENGYEWVDLGLPSGLKWATCNVGATAPEGSGDYFAWGETEPKTNYDWSTYKYCNGSETSLTKYNTESYYGTVDNKTTLELSDDAARANWGGAWRMPTKAEQDELKNNCTWTWTTQNGVNGYIVTSKTNGNSIFLPAAGLRYGTSVLFGGSYGHVWSSSLNESSPIFAYTLTFDSGSVRWLDYSRYNGHTVRAVCGNNTAAQTFTLTFNANGGTGTMAAQTFEAGVSQAIAANAFTRSGYTFTGWNTNTDGSGTSYTDKQSITLSQDITLYAQWKKDIVNYTVTFNANGGSGTMAAQTFEAGVSQAIAANAFTRSGYTFTGWNTKVDGSGTSYTDGQEITLSQDITLYAQWYQEQVVSGTENGHDYVDLGLPSGLKWATCNVGATTPEGYGDYFAWGETEPKTNYDYDFSTYKYCNGSSNTMTKYCTKSSYGYNGFTDGKTTLELSDDAARVNWDGKWRMPTEAEQNELRNNCTWTWSTQNGVNGYKVTSKTNGNSIFLPAAGYSYDGTSVSYVGSDGCYWSSSLIEKYPYYACYLSIRSGSVYLSSYHRFSGQSVRAVFSDNDKPSTFSTLTFNANGGTGTMAAQTFEAGVSQAIAANAFTRSGYTFTGWNTNADGSGTSYTDKQSITLTQDITLYAQWKSTQVVSGTENGHDYVDLGLPSGLKWATCNVGATTPEAYGDYFAWGETTSKDNYSWSTYKYCEGSSSTLTKYNNSASFGTVDNKTTLELADDAARANWGGAWRMPTKAEQDELRNNCTWTWTTQSGVNGYSVTSKTNGNSIFLPAAGYRSGASVYSVGSFGDSWASSLNEGSPSRTYVLYFSSDNVDCYYYYRYYGRTVRAVCP